MAKLRKPTPTAIKLPCRTTQSPQAPATNPKVDAPDEITDDARVLWRVCLFLVAGFDAEWLHLKLVGGLRILGRYPTLLRWLSGTPKRWVDPSRATPILNFPYLHPLGLAAGFDKNAELLPLLPALGFGYAEIGTVTLRPQTGNPRPRLYRFYRKQNIFNRMGFNNLGAEAVAANVRRARDRLPKGFSVGINLGKNKETEGLAIAQEYAAVATCFGGLADYFVINVSSPNTPGLRALQTIEALAPILEAVLKVAGRTPVWVKLAPEISDTELSDLVRALERAGCAGLVLGNTLQSEYRNQPGGMSGRILTERARTNLQTARAATALPIISVGGILSVTEAEARMEAGATALQIYTAWVMCGPRFPARVGRSLTGLPQQSQKRLRRS